MIDWKERGIEIAKIWYDHGHASVHYIIEQEKSIFKQLEADKAELLEALILNMERLCYDCTDNGNRKEEWKTCNCDYANTVKELIQKMEGSK